ncbi:uncharacterized protein [Pseudorasbora parva]
MAAGQTDLASLGFLNQTARMRSWLNSLNQAKIAEPTIHHYLKNVAQFLAYVAETPPPTSRLSRTVMVGLNREIKNMIRSVRRRVVMHEVKVKQAKEGRLISKTTLRQCLAKAKVAIPKILARLCQSPNRNDQWSFYGHLTAYFACIYGHRSGVFQNMTIQEVEAARKNSKDGCYVINISTHKTNQAFGAAQLALNEEEFEWMTGFLELRPYMVGGADPTYFFFTSKPSSCKNLNQYFQDAWAGMGLPGTPNFTEIRTSIATHAKNTHNPGDRHKVSQFMCHDTSTADRFYALNLDATQAREHRRLFEAAVEGEDTTPGSPEKKVRKRKRPTKPIRTTRPARRTPASPSPSDSHEEEVDSAASKGPTTPKKRRVLTPRKGYPLVLISPLKTQTLRILAKRQRKPPKFF